MGLVLALKAFMRGFKDPTATKKFLQSPLKEEAAIAHKERAPSHLRLLALLQQSGRLVDFLKEDISNYSDTQVGAAARQVHGECAKLIEEVVTVRPVLEQKEGSEVHIPAGYDPNEVKLTGQVKGNPPYAGVLIHGGWKAHKRSLPKQLSEGSSAILAAAEVEIKN